MRAIIRPLDIFGASPVTRPLRSTMDLLLLPLALVVLASFTKADQIELIPKMVRWPTRLDHYLCKQLHNGVGIRSHAVTNLAGDLCRTYCRIMDRMNGRITYTENISPNFVRCGLPQARCVDGTCVGLNLPTPGSAPPPPPPPPPEITAEGSEANTAPNEADPGSAEMSTGEAHSPVKVETTTTPSNFMYPISSNLGLSRE